MLNLKNTKLRVGLVAALFALTLAGGAVTAQAQGFCRQVRAHRFDIATTCGPYGCYQVRVPCEHWFTICD